MPNSNQVLDDRLALGADGNSRFGQRRRALLLDDQGHVLQGRLALVLDARGEVPQRGLALFRQQRRHAGHLPYRGKRARILLMAISSRPRGRDHKPSLPS